jgi:hypothetical protein
VAPDVPDEVLRYFQYSNVTAEIMRWISCTYLDDAAEHSSSTLARSHCALPYPYIKIRWSRFLLWRDWIKEFTTCIGPVLIADARDPFFSDQTVRATFGPPTTSWLVGLQVYEEHKKMATQLARRVAGRGLPSFAYNETTLCSGTTTGTRAAMITYLEAMHEEMKARIGAALVRNARHKLMLHTCFRAVSLASHTLLHNLSHNPLSDNSPFSFAE